MIRDIELYGDLGLGELKEHNYLQKEELEALEELAENVDIKQAIFDAFYFGAGVVAEQKNNNK